MTDKYTINFKIKVLNMSLNIFKIISIFITFEGSFGYNSKILINIY